MEQPARSLKQPAKQLSRCLLLLLLWWGQLGCSDGPKRYLGSEAGHLKPCPASPNCVSSESEDPARRIASFQLESASPQTWAELKKVVSALPRTRIVTASDDYLHAECRSAVFGFIDDVELQLQPQQQVAVRSAARLGYYDFGVNRKRVEELRRRLRAAGLIR